MCGSLVAQPLVNAALQPGHSPGQLPAHSTAWGRGRNRSVRMQRRFPRGVLVQEREVLAIQALRKLGRDAEADRRTEAFAKAFPGSAFARKLNAPR